jgi:heptose II phosphotransferase
LLHLGAVKSNQKPYTPKLLEHRGYRLSTTLDENAAKQLLDDLIEKSYTVKQTFKDSRSTYAAHLQLGKNNIVHKIPRARLRRLWEKLITLIRDSESIRTFNNLLLMDRLGFHAPNPPACWRKAEKRFRDRFILLLPL